MYKIELPVEEQSMCDNLEDQWLELLATTKSIDRSLVPVKKQFTKITLKQVTDFTDIASEFFKNFKEEGPSSVGADLDHGLSVLKSYKLRQSELESERGELAKAEKLFDLQITGFPELLEVDKEIKALDKIYTLYEDQKKIREEWANTLWANLNMKTLSDGIEEYIKQLRKFPKEIKGMLICQTLDEKMKEFKNSLPLIGNLKTDAMRDRHWERLMAETGKSFDMSPDTFTLANLFSMELHRFQEVIEDIVMSANKEMSIEKGLAEVEEIWRDLKFSTLKLVVLLFVCYLWTSKQRTMLHIQ